MIMETVADFDQDKAMAELAMKPHQNEWEALMSQFQNSSAGETAEDCIYQPKSTTKLNYSGTKLEVKL